MKSRIPRSPGFREVLDPTDPLVLFRGMLGLVALYLGGPVLVPRGSNPHVPGVQSWYIGGPILGYRGWAQWFLDSGG